VTQAQAPARKATLEEHWACSEWLNEESELLDDNRLREWLDRMHPELDYRLPIRVTVDRTKGPGHSETGYHLYEDIDSLTTRVDRLDTEYAWAEDPPSRTRRIVSNIRVTVTDAGEYLVRSNLLIYRGRLAATDFELLLGERHDVLVEGVDGLKLRSRLILLDHSTLKNKNMAVFF
jgi:3-phenylpropionate/cinnamic acid dioxygenase small subunit